MRIIKKNAPGWHVRLPSGLQPAAPPRSPGCPAGRPPGTKEPLAPPPAHATPAPPRRSWPAAPAKPQTEAHINVGSPAQRASPWVATCLVGSNSGRLHLEASQPLHM